MTVLILLDKTKSFWVFSVSCKQWILLILSIAGSQYE